MSDREIRMGVRLLVAGVGWSGLPDEQLRGLTARANQECAIRQGEKRDPCRDPARGDVVLSNYGYSRHRHERRVAEVDGTVLCYEARHPDGHLFKAWIGLATWRAWTCGGRGSVVKRGGNRRRAASAVAELAHVDVERQLAAGAWA